MGKVFIMDDGEVIEGVVFVDVEVFGVVMFFINWVREDDFLVMWWGMDGI